MPKRASSIEYRKDLREKILSVSQVLFATKGFKAVKMDDIAAELVISKRTLYEIYPNKEDLIYESFKNMMDNSLKNFGERISGLTDTMDILTQFIALRIKQMRHANPCIVEELKSYPRVKEYIDSFREMHREHSARFYKKAQEEGYIRKDINLKLVHDIYRNLDDSFFANKSYINYEPEELFRTMMSMFVRSFCTQKGVLRFDRMFDETTVIID